MSTPGTAHATERAIEAASGHRWHAWLSDTGQWWAARRAALPAAALAAGCIPFACASNPDELLTRIREQDDLSAEHDRTQAQQDTR